MKPKIRRPGLDLVFGFTVLDKVGAYFQSLSQGSFAPCLFLEASPCLY